MTQQATIPSGVLAIDKPPDLTSHDVVARVRRQLQELPDAPRTVGHTGTLDPFATGLLLVAVGSATRLIEYTHAWPKTYEATLTLGATSDTDDVTGTITPTAAANEPDRGVVESALNAFRGTITQTPPAYSAIKVAGERSYKKARRGEQSTPPPRTITIHRLEMTDYDYPKLQIKVECSTGTYIRALARDIGSALGVGAYTETLRRVAIGPFDISQAIQLDELSTDMFTAMLKPAKKLITHLPALTLPDESVAQLIDGKAIPWQKSVSAGPVALLTEDNQLVGIGHYNTSTSLLHPEKILTR